ncbi:MAG: hypothetical protein PHQ34_06930 [Methanothrix sp.]|nr:hypothetical protein [Methanothrix sp.]
MLTLPTKMDWNNLNGKKWTTELRDQNPGHITPEPATCVAFGVLAVLEALLKIHYYNDPSQPLDLSEGRLWTCGHRWAAKGYPDGDCSNWKDDTGVGTDAWAIEPPLRYLKKFGVASAIEDYDKNWPQKCVCEASSPNTKIKSFQMISITGTGNAEDWKVAQKKKLVMYGPLIVEYSLPAPKGGTHCVAIVGYDINGFLIKDSLNKDHTSLPYNTTAFIRLISIEVFKPRLNINIDGVARANALSLKVVKIASKYTRNLAEVDPTVLPNLQNNFNASYNSASGWLSIRPEVAGGTISLPLHLAVPPGSYDIYVEISGHRYHGSAVIGTLVSDIPIEITLQDQHNNLSLNFDAVNNKIAANWNAALECAHYSSFKAHIRVRDYQDNSLLIEKHDLAIACENGIISSEISISEILPHYAGKLCKVEVRYDNLGQLSEWSEPVGIALVTPYAEIKRLESGLNGIFIKIVLYYACSMETQIYDGNNKIDLEPSDIESHKGISTSVMPCPSETFPHCYNEGEWVIDSNITTFRPSARIGRTILRISPSKLGDPKIPKIYNVKVRAKDDHFFGPVAEQQITWEDKEQDPTWLSEDDPVPIEDTLDPINCGKNIILPGPDRRG